MKKKCKSLNISALKNKTENILSEKHFSYNGPKNFL